MDEVVILSDQYLSRTADRRDVFDQGARRQEDCWSCGRCIRAGTASRNSSVSQADERIGNSSYRFRIAVLIRDLLSRLRPEYHHLSPQHQTDQSQLKSFL